MFMADNVCPHCGHVNLKRAIFCFECGTPLSQNKPIKGMKPHYQEDLKDADAPDMKDTDRQIAVPTIQELADSRATKELAAQYHDFLKCLRCGTENLPNAESCQQCGASLIVPDEIYGLKLVGSARSSVGQVRSNNEDNVGLWARGGVILALVADGMGGAAAGEEASRLAKEAVQADFTGAARGSELLQELTEDEVQQKLRDALHYANEAVLDKISQDKSFQGMGTTATMAFIRGNRVIIAHIGDSRAYLIEGDHGWIHQITDDHSFVEVLVASGHITRQQASIHPMRSVLYRALGQMDAAEADLYTHYMKADDCLVLCSDGLTRHLDAEEIAEIVHRSDDPEVISQELIDLANLRGGEDNISVVVVRAMLDDSTIPLENLIIINIEDERPSKSSDNLFQTAQFDNINLDDILNSTDDDDTPES
jgi:PPM family protein phosphatase